MVFANYQNYMTPFKVPFGLGMAGLAAMYGNPQQRRIGYTPKGQFQSYTQRRRVRGGRRPTLKNAIRNLETAQHLASNDNNLQQAMTHNTIYTHCPTAQITQGTSNSARTNEEIYLEAIKLRVQINDLGSNTQGTSYRFLVLYADPDFDPGTGFGSGLGLTDLAIGASGTLVTSDVILDPKKVTVVYDNITTLNNFVSASAEVSKIVQNVQLKKAFVYKPGGKFGKDRNLYLVIIGSTPGGTSGTTMLGTLTCNYDLIFRNSK